MFKVKVKLPDNDNDIPGVCRIYMPECWNFAFRQPPYMFPYGTKMSDSDKEHALKCEVISGIRSFVNLIERELREAFKEQGVKL